MDQIKNCFNFIRLYACLNVLLYHMDLYMNVRIPIFSSLVNPINGVPVFFLLSGFLIWLSLERNDKFKTFCIKRVLRLYPELWFCIILEIVFLLLLYSGPNIIDYLQLIVFQGFLMPSYTPYAFRDYGIGSLNVSLWTIPVIIQFYFIIWIVYRWFRKLSMIAWIFFIFVLVGVSSLLSMRIQDSWPHLIQVIIAYSVGYHLWMFFIGCFIANFFDYIVPILTKYWYISLVALILCEIHPIQIDSVIPYSFSGVLLLALTVFGFGYRFSQISVKTDISYAVYLYHMMYANVAIQLGYKGNILAVIIIIFITFISSYFSTKLISGILKNRCYSSLKMDK